MIDIVRIILAGILMLCGLFTIFTAMLGVFRFNFALNRMHTAALSDTLGIMCVMLSLALMFGFSAATLKLILIILFFWISSPVSSHLVAKLEVMTDEDLPEHAKEEDWRKKE